MVNEKTQKLFDQIQKGKEEIDAIKKELATKVQTTFHELSKELFTLYPELKSFGWTQYTPYFNDGEECTFRVNHRYPTINGFNSDYGKEGPEGWINITEGAQEQIYDSGFKPNPNFNPYYKEIIDNVKEFLSKFGDDDFLSIFNNHVEVTITADGVKTAEYEHE